MKWLSGSILLLVMLSLPRCASTEAKEPAEAAPADRAALEKQLADKLSNARMSGFYTIEGQKSPPQQDSYTLGKVEKKEGNKWLFNARIEYGKKAFSVPLELPVLWAGDTPVITVSQMTIPTLGTYTARVLIHGDSYAGTWSSPQHQGYLWGRLEHNPQTAPAVERH